jgi:hypothetical protein
MVSASFGSIFIATSLNIANVFSFVFLVGALVGASAGAASELT